MERKTLIVIGKGKQPEVGVIVGGARRRRRTAATHFLTPLTAAKRNGPPIRKEIGENLKKRLKEQNGQSKELNYYN